MIALKSTPGSQKVGYYSCMKYSRFIRVDGTAQSEICTLKTYWSETRNRGLNSEYVLAYDRIDEVNLF